MRARSLTSLLLVGIAVLAPAPASAVESRLVHDGDADFRVVTIDLRDDALDLYWLDPNGSAYGSIEALRQGGEAEGRTLAFATNAGIYDREYRPLGLTIARGRTLRSLNTTKPRGGSGNFGMQPNGIFYVDQQGRAGVVRTDAWRSLGIGARIATQSGPMLVVDGEINPSFVEGSDSRKWRSGVCAPAPDKAVFAVSIAPVTFHAFARLFRDTLGCRDALFLDGTLSQIYTADEGYSGAPDMMVKPYAGMLAVFAGTPDAR
ncbi:MAG TPA: phosphodiester glycosidase family protein [Rhodanobacteraceae bacterium]|nr:phosphodiester glycosidase family protein [Rhodanobacteraceae bacterium]